MFTSAPILMGQYRPLDSFLHRLDARAKMGPITLALILALMTNSFTYYIILMLTLMAGLVASRVEISTIGRNFQPMLILALVTTLYHLVFSGDGVILVSIFGWDIYSNSLQLAAFYSLRLILFVSVAFLLTLTNSPSEIAEAIASVLKPLKALKVPVDDLALILFMAIRFIPVLYEEFIAIRNAQQIRGVRFSGSLVNRIRKTSAIIIPVFVAAIGRADDIALAIEARGYGTSDRRTTYTRARLGLAEGLFTISTCGGISLLYFLTS